MTRPSRFVLALGLATLACNKNSSASAADDAPLAEFRRSLADPKQFPIRKGMEIDEAAMRTALLQATDKHKDEIKRRYDASIAALPSGNIPGSATHDERATFEVPDETEFREAGAMFWAIDADVEQSAWRAVSMYLHIAMTQAGLTSHQVGVWLGFLHVVRPLVTRCGQQSDNVSVCLDYGGIDVFVIELVPHGDAWVTRRLRWLQQKQ